MSLPAVTLRRKGTTSSGRSGPPNETSSRASYGSGPEGMLIILGRGDAAWSALRRCTYAQRAMLESYRAVFAHRGAAAFSTTGMLARLPISMMTLGIVLLVSSVTGSYAV